MRINGIGPTNPKLILVGEAWGEDEAEQGVPFVGKAGRVLNAILSDAGISRADCYITNLINERPSPGSSNPNDISSYILGTQLTDIGREAQEGLIQELAGVDCRVIVPMGNTALAALTDVDLGEFTDGTGEGSYERFEGIVKWRGSPLRSQHLPGRWIVPTLHSSYIQRGKWAEAWLVVNDLRKAVRLLESEPETYQQHTHHDPAAALALLTAARNQPAVAFDIETPGQELACFSLCWEDHAAHCVPFSEFSTQDRQHVLRSLRALLSTACPTRIVMQNGNYEISWLKRFHGMDIALEKCDDTMYLHHCLYPEIPKKLAVLSSLYTDLAYYKGDYEESQRTADKDLLHRYNAMDAQATWAAWRALEAHPERSAIEHTYRNLTMANLEAIQVMQNGTAETEPGFRVDHRAWAKLRETAEAEIKPLQDQLDSIALPWLMATKQAPRPAVLAPWKVLVSANREAQRAERERLAVLYATAPRGHKAQFKSSSELDRLRNEATDLAAEISKLPPTFNVSSNLQVREYFHAMHEIRQSSYDEPALRLLARPTSKRDGYREAPLILAIREQRKQLENFLSARLDERSRFRFSLNPRGTKFGRLAGGKLHFRLGHNPLNLPHSFKSVFIADMPRDGVVPFFFNMDGSKAEYVHVANLANEHRMLDAIANGTDVHALTGALLAKELVTDLALNAILTGGRETGVPISVVMAEHEAVGERTSVTEIALARKGCAPYMALDVRHRQLIEELIPDCSIRQFGKKRNHAWNYKETPHGYAARTGTALSVAIRQHQAQCRAYPGVVQWWDKIRWTVRNQKQLVNCFKRIIPFRHYFTDETWKAACSALPQSGVADSTNAAMREIVGWHDPLVVVRNNIYDALLTQQVIDTRASRKGELARLSGTFRRMVELMSPWCEYEGRRFRVAVDCKIGTNWGKLDKLTDLSPDGIAPKVERIIENAK